MLQLETENNEQQAAPTPEPKNGNGRTPDTPNNPSASKPSWIDLLAEYEYPRPRQGEIINGEIIRIEEDVMFINVGAKRDAIVPHDELADLDEDLLNELSRGDTVPVYVLRTPVGNEELLVSLEKGLQQLDWDRAERLLETDETVDCQVVGHNKGGLLVQFGRLRGFVPNSHEPDLKRIHDNKKRMTARQKKVGDILSLKVVEIDRSRERLIMSATAAEKEQRLQQLQALNVGDTVSGEVVNLTPYGAFIDLGHVSGLLHISKISWENIDHPSDALQVGDEVQVRIDKVDVDRERISLNRKALLPGPWEQFAEQHEEGELVEGVVTAVTDFGAFVLVADNVEGLVHISEIDNQYLENPENVVQPGDTVLTRILSIELDRERLGLSMRRVSANEEVEWMLEHRRQEAVPAVTDEAPEAEPQAEAAEQVEEVEETETAVAPPTELQAEEE
ncbi:MAG: S1 RNA-binding domain-containing protein [Anaerolineales bacterium]|nr:S1 RNA-binding domain-containing protein [Anaerolineales bacterium]